MAGSRMGGCWQNFECGLSFLWATFSISQHTDGELWALTPLALKWTTLFRFQEMGGGIQVDLWWFQGFKWIQSVSEGRMRRTWVVRR